MREKSSITQYMEFTPIRGGVGGSWPIVDSIRFLTIFYISTIKFARIYTKNWGKKASIYSLIFSNSTKLRTIFEKIISTFEIVKFYIHTSPIILQIYNFFLTKFYILQLFSLKILHLRAPLISAILQYFLVILYILQLFFGPNLQSTFNPPPIINGILTFHKRNFLNSTQGNSYGQKI